MFLAVAAGVAVSAHVFGGYEVGVWAPLGVVLVSAVVVLVATGHRPTRLVTVGAAALVLLGGWSLLSTAWGGLPHDAWRVFDQAVLAAAALVAGSALASRPQNSAVVVSGVLAGVTAQAVEVLARLAIGNHPVDWVHERFLQGPIGYHNAQGVFFALAVPLALWQASRPGLALRIAGGVSGGLLLGALLLTQSRAALIALGIGVLVQLVFARSVRLVWLAALFAGAAIALGLALRHVDAALLEGAPDEKLDALRLFGLWTVLAALVLGGLATLTPPRAITRALAVLAACSLVAILAVGAVREGRFPGSDFTLSKLVSDNPPKAAPGQTRIVSLSLNGRKEAWRVARKVSANAPIVGAGQGQFARSWAQERRLTNLYILQPHSVELEFLSELGIVGLALFGTFAVLAVIALVRAPDRAVAAAGLGAAGVLVTQASVDWTWSFPGIVAPVLLVVGAASGAGAKTPRTWLAKGCMAAVALAALVSFGAPYAAQAELTRAADVQADAERAWGRAETARRLDPWNPMTFDLEARLAARMGKLDVAAEHYGRAAELSQRPWLERFRQARILAQAGAHEASRRACRLAIAENPGEVFLQGGLCSGDLLVSSSPQRSDPVPLDGATIAGSVYIFATAGAQVRVLFFLDDPKMAHAPRAEETRDPYDLAGTSPAVTRNAKPFDTTELADGAHTLTAAIRVGKRLAVVRARFIVSNGHA